MVNLKALAAKQGVMNLAPMGGIVVAQDQAAADFLRNLAQKKQYGIGREIPRAEIARFPATLPSSAVAVFEPAEGFMFSGAPNGEVVNKPAEIGNHGHWPMRYRSVYVLWGPGISHEAVPEFSLKDIAGRFANVLGVPFQH
jgi:hypothetical protein